MVCFYRKTIPLYLYLVGHSWATLRIEKNRINAWFFLFINQFSKWVGTLQCWPLNGFCEGVCVCVCVCVCVKQFMVFQPIADTIFADVQIIPLFLPVGASCVCVCVCCVRLITQLCLILCDPIDCSPRPPGSSVHGILQARILEWVAMPFSRGLFQPRDRTQVSLIAGGFFTSWVTREVQDPLSVDI